MGVQIAALPADGIEVSKDYCGWLRGQVGPSMSSDRAHGRGQWSIAGDIGFRPTYRSD
jgi:hypothetical protein